MPADDIRDRLAQPRPVLLDGALGTELTRRGFVLPPPLWSTAALLDVPELVRSIHADYVAAGAEIVTACTFRTHALNLQPAGMADRAAELTRRAVELAREAAGGSVRVAGSQAPLGDCYRPDEVPEEDRLLHEHRRMAGNLAAAGVDLILGETLTTIREAVAVCQACHETGLPFAVSFVVAPTGRLMSGESPADAVAAVRPYAPQAVLVNCLPAKTAGSVVAEMQTESVGLPLGVYANTGWMTPDGDAWRATDATDPARYAEYAARWLDQGVRIVGGCCGTTPEHIRALRQLIDNRFVA